MKILTTYLETLYEIIGKYLYKVNKFEILKRSNKFRYKFYNFWGPHEFCYFICG